MASLTNSDAEEGAALALRWSKLSPGEFDEQLARLRPEGSMSGSHPCTPTSDEKDDLALALRLSQLSSDGIDEEVTRLYRMESAPAGEKARSSVPPNESEEDDLELALGLSQLPTDSFDEQVSRQSGPPAALEGALTSLFTAMSLVRVRGHHSYI